MKNNDAIFHCDDGRCDFEFTLLGADLDRMDYIFPEAVYCPRCGSEAWEKEGEDEQGA